MKNTIFACLALSVVFATLTPVSAQVASNNTACSMTLSQPLNIPSLRVYDTPAWDRRVNLQKLRAKTFFTCLEEEAVICNPSERCEPAPIPGFPASVGFFIEDPEGPFEGIEGCTDVQENGGCWWFLVGCFLAGDKPSGDANDALCCPGNPIPGAPECP